MPKTKTETKDDDSDVEFVPMSPQPAAKNGNGKGGGGSDGGVGAGDRNHPASISAVNRGSTDDKRSSTSITIKNSSNKPVISPRTASTTRCVPVSAKRILNVASKVTMESNVLQQSVDAGAQSSPTTRMVNVVTRQNDGTVILRKVQMTSKQNVAALKRSLGSQLSKMEQKNVVPVNESTPKRAKFDDKPTASAAHRVRDFDLKRNILTKATAISSTRPHLVVRPKSSVEISKIQSKNRRIANADNSQPQDSEKVTTTPMAALSVSEHQYAKRTNDIDAIASDTEKPSPQTPLSATEHHYSKRNNNNSFSVPTPRNRWRPTMATATVVATAADSTRTDDIKSSSTTMAPSTSPILLNEVLSRMRPAIRVRSVQSLNNNAKN